MKKSVHIWNTYICPAIEVAGYCLVALMLAAAMYITVVMLLLVAN